MDKTQALQNAARRREELELEYAGAVTPEEAYCLSQQADAAIVDVRTNPELNYVGSIPGALAINWQIYPDMAVNEKFLDELKRAVPKGQAVLFVCRSGVRSHYAAMLAAQAGWAGAYNVLEGFEGDLDESGRRGNINGWRHRGLPWEQT